MRQIISRFKLGFQSLCIAGLLIGLKLVLLERGWEFLTLNALITSAIAAAIFIVGFLLSGIIADYKESERIPGEMRAALENLLSDALAFQKTNTAFDATVMREKERDVVRTFMDGVHVSRSPEALSACITAINALGEPISQMEMLGMPANYVVRLRGEQGALRRAVLRVYHVQRTQFIPSAHILAESLIVFVIGLLLFLSTEGSPESLVVFAFISYLFTYVGLLITVIEQPFRQGAGTQDDVSLFLLREFEEKISGTTGA